MASQPIARSRLALERRAQNRRRLLFAFHGQKQPLGHLLGAFCAGFRSSLARRPSARCLAASRGSERHNSVRRPRSAFRALASSAGTALRAPPGRAPGGTARYRRVLARAPACIFLFTSRTCFLPPDFRKQGSAKRETIDLAAHAPAVPDRPDLRRVERDTGNDPAQRVAGRLEHGAEGLGLRVGHTDEYASLVSIRKPNFQRGNYSGAPRLGDLALTFYTIPYGNPLRRPRGGRGAEGRKAAV